MATLKERILEFLRERPPEHYTLVEITNNVLGTRITDTRTLTNDYPKLTKVSLALNELIREKKVEIFLGQLRQAILYRIMQEQV